MKNQRTKSLLLVIMIAVFTACSGDDSGNDVAGPDIEDLPSQVSIDNGATYAVTITLVAEGRMDYMLIYKDDVQLGDSVLFEGEKETTYDFSYQAQEADNDDHVVFDFQAVDRNVRARTETLILSVGDAPQP